MKILLFLVTLLLGAWLWRRNRLKQRREREQAQPSRAEAQASQGPQSQTPSPMLACKQCGVHMPAHDMVQGHQGHYCSVAHCQADADTPLPKR